MSCGTTRRTLSMGMAKPTPAEVPVLVKMAVFTPMRRPRESSSGPPELPGLIAASIWMPPAMVLPARVPQHVSGAPSAGAVRLHAAAERRACLALDDAAEARDGAGGERVVEAEGIANGEALLAHAHGGAARERQRLQQLARRVDAQHDQVLAAQRARERGGVVALHALRVQQRHPRHLQPPPLGKLHAIDARHHTHARARARLDVAALRGGGAQALEGGGEDVVVGDDEAVGAPHEAAAVALRHVRRRHGAAALQREVEDVGDAARAALEHADRRLLRLAQRRRRRYVRRYLFERERARRARLW